MVRALSLLDAALAQRGEVRGAVRFVAGRGPADLLTLRAVRALGAADILAPDADADPEVLRMARRDAVWLTGEAAEVERLIAEAQAGRQVVRVVTGAIPPEEGRRLAASGVTVEVLLAAPES
jgi:precorrin-2 dehydrogenase/sirohydrochlorin ferrochelatase